MIGGPPYISTGNDFQLRPITYNATTHAAMSARLNPTVAQPGCFI